jgi:hypothetical protein
MKIVKSPNPSGNSMFDEFIVLFDNGEELSRISKSTMLQNDALFNFKPEEEIIAYFNTPEGQQFLKNTKNLSSISPHSALRENPYDAFKASLATFQSINPQEVDLEGRVKKQIRSKQYTIQQICINNSINTGKLAEILVDTGYKWPRFQENAVRNDLYDKNYSIRQICDRNLIDIDMLREILYAEGRSVEWYQRNAVLHDAMSMKYSAPEVCMKHGLSLDKLLSIMIEDGKNRNEIQEALGHDAFGNNEEMNDDISPEMRTVMRDVKSKMYSISEICARHNIIEEELANVLAEIGFSLKAYQEVLVRHDRHCGKYSFDDIVTKHHISTTRLREIWISS